MKEKPKVVNFILFQLPFSFVVLPSSHTCTFFVPLQDPEAEDSQRRDVHAPEVEMERSPVPDIYPPSPPPLSSATASADTSGPSYTAQHSPEYVHVSTRELAGVMDVVCLLASTQASMDQRLTRAETTLEQCHTMISQIMSHLGLPHDPSH